MYYYDFFGWYSVNPIIGALDRVTNIAPPTDIPDGYQANWTGVSWVVLLYTLPPDLVPSDIVVTVHDFMLLFTSAERISIRLSTNPAVQDWLSLLQDTRLLNVSLRHPSVVMALHLLNQLGILADGRVDQIQTNRVPCE